MGVQNFIDLRLNVRRMVDTVATPFSDGTVSPSPSPAVPWTAISRSKPDSLVQAAMAPFTDKVAGIASKVRWHYVQKFISLASQRQDLVDITGTSTDLGNFLVRWVNDYEANKTHEWIVGEGTVIAWPDKNPATKISLRRYSPPVFPSLDDGITIETVKDWGPVSVLTKYIRADDNYRYPILFNETLAFVSDRSLQIPGHTKLSGSFSFQPKDTWIVDNAITFQLHQLQNSVDVIIGTVDIDWTRANSFSNATGVIRIDGDSIYNPSTGYISINYNQTVNFTADQPGRIAPLYRYNDLTQVHPIYTIDIGAMGLSVSHLFEVKGYSVVNGVITEMPNLIRLEGITFASGKLYVRLNRDDVFAVISARGIFRTKWVLRNIPWITITKVTNDANGVPASVDYTVNTVDDLMTLSTLLANDTRCKQVYLPCALKYGWVDIGQTNIHTEDNPQNTSPKFGFFQLQSVGGTDTAVTLPGPIYAAFTPSDVDYRFLEPYTGPTGLETIRSVAIARNYKTGETRTFAGVYRIANGSGDTTSFSDEITLATITEQDAVFFYDTLLTPDWILDFAGILVAVDDDPSASSPSGKSKLMVAGYWYGGHTVSERVNSMTRFRSDSVQFNSPTKNPAFFRIGDVPMSFLYRGNTLLHASRTRG